MPGSEDYRQHHYVPQWYQKKFMLPNQTEYSYLNLQPKSFKNAKGKVFFDKNLRTRGAKMCFVEKDLYTTKIEGIGSKDIEKFFFGDIDRKGQDALEYFQNFDYPMQHYRNFLDEILIYMSTQRLRTPKGLSLIRNQLRTNNRDKMLAAMIYYTNEFSALWVEAIWQIADASQSPTKFIVSDHPVTFYNRQCGPNSSWCKGLNDPDIFLQGTHTLFPLSIDKILILTHGSWVRNPYSSATKARPNTRRFGDAIFKFTDIQVKRILTEEEVLEINYVIKARAHQFIAAANEDWLYPEYHLSKIDWINFGKGYLFMPDPRPINSGSEFFMGYKNGRTDTFDQYGRRPWNKEFSDEKNKGDEFRTLQRFKGDFAYLFGPVRRGRIAGINAAIEDEVDPENYHNYHLSNRTIKYKERNK